MHKRNGVMISHNSPVADLCFRFDDGECVIQSPSMGEFVEPVETIKRITITFAGRTNHARGKTDFSGGRTSFDRTDQS